MGTKILGVSPVFFRSMDRKFLLFRRGSFMGQIFLYRANFEIKKKGKRLDFQTLPRFRQAHTNSLHHGPKQPLFLGRRPLQKMEDEEKTICCKRKGCETSWVSLAIRMHLRPAVMVDPQVMQYHILCAGSPIPGIK